MYFSLSFNTQGKVLSSDGHDYIFVTKAVLMSRWHFGCNVKNQLEEREMEVRDWNSSFQSQFVCVQISLKQD